MAVKLLETVAMCCCWVFRLIVGYVFHSDGSMYAVTECDLQLDSVGEDGDDPVDCKFNFIAGFHFSVILLLFSLTYIPTSCCC